MPGSNARVAAVGALLLLAGCGSPDDAGLPVACVGEPAAIAQALERAPAAVTLAGGTSLSGCVRRAREDGELQALGLLLTQVADGLRVRAASDPAAALQLGYLVGAMRRGERGSPGLASQLARRIEQIAMLEGDGPRTGSQLERGIRAGEAGG